VSTKVAPLIRLLANCYGCGQGRSRHLQVTPLRYSKDVTGYVSAIHNYISKSIEILFVSRYVAAMDQEIAVKRLAELGNATRMSVFRLIVKAGDEGISVGEINSRINVAAPTLSHHLHRLMVAELIVQRRVGRTLYCVAKLEALRDVLHFLESECCTIDPL